MRSDKAKDIALLGGSFNPPHIGHIEICRYLLGRGNIDQVWIIPCFQHPFGKSLAPFEDRLAMCRFTFQEFGERVWITDIERRLGGVSHTVRTIEHFKYRFPGRGFALVFGSDVSGERCEWRDFDRIRKMVSIVEIPRGRDSFIACISSSEIRERIRNGEDISQYVVTPVSVYIVTHGLYY